MPKKMLIDATHAEETRVVVVDGNKVEEFDFESQFKRQLAGNIYLAKVTRVEPSLQAAFVDYGGNRHGFLAFSEIHPDYYQIPIADREALIAEEKAYADSLKAEEEDEEAPKRRRQPSRSKAANADNGDAVATEETGAEDSDDAPREKEVSGMETIDLDEDDSESPAIGDDNDAASKDDRIEKVTDDDLADDVRPVRKPRPKRYKIQEVIKVRQILLVQVVKEERGNKGAALTTYLSLAGRYCVLMPNTARGGGISRKITNAADRKKLKEIAGTMSVPEGAGLIIRTAGSQRTKTEIKRDYEYLQRMWEQIRELTLKSTAPAKIYEEGDLIKRSIRDLYNREIDEVIVAGDDGYKTAKAFMKMIMPSHAKNVKHYNEQLPLYARYQVEGYLAGMFNPSVQLPSGGYIVIGVTEALVAIDVNSGRATKEGSIEQTALKTNLEAADEVARQLRLRDLAGLIVIDFIDMDERKNNAAVEKRFKESLNRDRARIQVGRISGFGLMEMSRQRLRPGMLEATTQMCSHCHGTGLLRSDDNVALAILRALEEEGVRGRSKEVLVKAPISIANFLMNGKREHIADVEARYGMSVRIECDPTLVSPDYALEKFKTATRSVPEAAPFVVGSVEMMDEISEDDDILLETADEDEAEEQVQQQPRPEQGEDDGDKPKRKRRRRRRRRKTNGDDQSEGQNGDASDDESDDDETPAKAEPAGDVSEPDAAAAETEAKPKRRTRSRRKAPAKTDDVVEADTSESDAKPEDAVAATAETAPVEADAQPEEKPKRRTRTRKKKADDAPAPVEPVSQVEATPDAEVKGEVEAGASEVEAQPQAEAQPASEPEPQAEPAEAAKPAPRPRTRRKASEVISDVVAAVAEPVAEVAEKVEEAVTPEKDAEDDKPKKRGWWRR
ncbi:MAG: Rne/Rng family ribonuclease [Paracoccaceae bacterium]